MRANAVVYRLENSIRNYAWGSTSQIAKLLGRPSPSSGPEAEMWMGAHPTAPSKIELDQGWVFLDSAIAQNPEHFLGVSNTTRFGAELPFLFKVLAAERPLSLQTHPSLEQAKAGFAREEAAGVPITARERNYKDPHEKPELLVALSPFEAIAGFRDPEEGARLVAGLGLPEFGPLTAWLARPDPLHAAVAGLLALDAKTAQHWSEKAHAAARRLIQNSEAADRDSYQAVWRLAEDYPGDIGAIFALLLNYERLEPGEALFLPNGVLHAYLGGLAVELMANSDNVLRAGLTPKHVDREELLRVVDFERIGSMRVEQERVPGTGFEEIRYPTPATEFSLCRIELAGADGKWRRPAAVSGAEVLLGIEGELTVTTDTKSLGVGRGQSLFVAADTRYEIRGRGALFRASPHNQAAPRTPLESPC